MKRKVCVQSHIFGAFLTLCQFGENEESFPSATLAGEDAKALHAHCKRVQVASSDTAGTDRANGENPTVHEECERGENAGGEDPSRDFEWNGRFNAARPTREGQQVDCGEGVDTIDGKRDKQEHPEEEIGESFPARVGLEVVEVLKQRVSVPGLVSIAVESTYHIVPFFLQWDISFFTIARAPHDVYGPGPARKRSVVERVW